MQIINAPPIAPSIKYSFFLSVDNFLGDLMNNCFSNIGSLVIGSLV